VVHTRNVVRESSFTLPADPGSARQARDWARPLLVSWQVDGDPSDVLLVLSELVANAVRHGRGPVDVRMSRPGDRLRIEVTDADPSRVAPSLSAPGTRTSGRGLVLVRELSARWGVSYGEQGKTVWAELDT
jgi:signal transduction histidine kinase